MRLSNKILLFLILFSIMRCTHSKTENSTSENNTTDDNNIDSVLNSIIGNQETIIISTEDNDTLSYTKEELKDILKYYPEINDEYPKHPDLSYAITVNKSNNINTVEFDSHQFGSEVGQDNYFRLYGCFLKHRNGAEKYKGMRDTLILIYRRINGINEGLAEGGTYFGHQHRRILGNVEFDILRYKTSSRYLNKVYNIENQKVLFLKLLQQRILDEENINAYNMTAKAERKKRFDIYVNNLDNLITDYFYLKMAQEFQYSNY